MGNNSLIEGLDLRVVAQILIADGFEFQRLAAQRGDDFILDRDLRFQSFGENFFIREIAPADAVVADLVCKGWADAAPRSAGRARAFGLFVQAVQQLVIGHDHVRARRDQQPPVQGDALPLAAN